MPITKKEVEHIARLSRIEIAADEEEKFGKELSSVLDFIGKLNQVNTENVAPLTGGTDLINSMRKDEISGTALSRKEKLETAAKLVTSAPEHREGFVKVKAVFE